jgi:hypothetical protein
VCFICNIAKFGNARVEKIVNGLNFDELEYIDIDARYSRNFATARNISHHCRCHVSEYDCQLYKELIAKTGQYSFSIVVDIISFVKLRKLLKIACRLFYNKIHKIGNMQINEKGKDPIHLAINYKTIYGSSLLCQIFNPDFQFSPDDYNKNGEFIFKSTKYGLSQDYVQLYSTYSHLIQKCDRKKLIGDYLSSLETYVEFCTAYDNIKKMFNLFGQYEEQLDEILGEYLHDYTKNTIFLDGKNGKDRLLLFCCSISTIAEFIWTGTFSTKREREIISYKIHLPNKLRGAFINSNSFTSLVEKMKKIKELDMPSEYRWINELPMMGHTGKQLYDSLCRLDYARHLAKYPSYISGYIDSEKIDIANELYSQKYSEAQSFYSRIKEY